VRPLFHLLDPLWCRVPLPVVPKAEVRRVGGVTALRMWRAVAGREILAVYCFVVGDTLVDTGLASLGGRVSEFARAHGVRRAVITHHHEDHAGNAARLVDEGIEVLAPMATGDMLAADAPIPFYEHLVWGKAPPSRPAPLPAEVPLGDRLATVIPAPGHCADQVCLHVPAEGWLFSGDAFLHERVKVFRRDEDFALTVSTLERLCALDFDGLYCAHRPRVIDGKAALRAKLDWLRGIEARVRVLHAEGRGVGEIVGRLGLRESTVGRWLTAGDASTANMVRSILYGPTPRALLTARPHR
jgi:glyoxylase-like metal-dependent hydrolase (beta-lactamase superfamily II)